jgi:hypothetical protein
MSAVDCKTCAYSLVCMSGRFPKDWQPLWQCADCGVIAWGYPAGLGRGARTMLMARCSIRERQGEAKHESVCRKCYWKRELAEDAAHEERLRNGEIEPRYHDWRNPA